MLDILSNNHDFDLANPVPKGEAYRLLNFIEIWEEPGKYPEIGNVERKLFFSARCEIRLMINEKLAFLN